MRSTSKLAGAASPAAVVLVGALHLQAVRIDANEVTVQNDSVADGATATICPCFIAGESVASWLTSPCNGNIVAVQVFWRSQFGGMPPTLEDSISLFAAGAFPFPGSVMLNQPGGAPAIFVGPVMTDGAANEFRFLDELMTIPLNVPVNTGQEFVVSLKLFNDSPLLGPSVIYDSDGCQPGKNVVDVLPGGWLDACLLGVTGDWFVRAVVDCAALPGACCEIGGGCANGVSESECGASGGAYQGDESNCGSVTCDEACCFQPTGCLNLTVENCGIATGEHQGPGSDCASIICFPTGACCFPDGSCIHDLLDVDCAAQGGTFQGDETFCTGVSCPQPLGACCVASGNCLALSEDDCGVIPGGSWAGFGTDCDDLNGNGVPDDCGDTEVIPTVSEWGLAVMSMLMLAAGTIVFERRRGATAAATSDES